MFLLGIVTVLVTALVPVFVWRLGAKQAKRDDALNKRQAKTLASQEQILLRQRRDSLLEIVDRSSDATHLGLLWCEVLEYEGKDRELLLAAFRSNVALALPGSTDGVTVSDNLTDTVVAHYVSGLERRYAERTSRYPPYRGLLDFLVAARVQRATVEASKIVSLVTGPTAANQRPSHGFYRDLVNVLPESAGGLLNAVERINHQSSGGIRLNVLTGTLLAIKDVEIGRSQRQSAPREYAVAELRRAVPVALASLLHRDNLRSFDRWSLEGSTEPVTATVAWLVRAVGWFADTDDHLALRMIPNLSAAIDSIPTADAIRGWGTDDEDVRVGLDGIMQKRPALWEAYGPGLEAAAAKVGSWNLKGERREAGNG